MAGLAARTDDLVLSGGPGLASHSALLIETVAEIARDEGFA
jgi:hypothetical protein